MENIFDYHKNQYNLNVARKKVIELIEKTMFLEQSPNLGKPEELLKNRKYKIIYFVDKQQIVISTVFDCRQNPRKMKNIVD